MEQFNICCNINAGNECEYLFQKMGEVMAKFKVKFFLLIVCIILCILSTTGCSFYEERRNESYSKISLWELSTEANQKGLDSVDNGHAEDALHHFEKALDYAQQYIELMDGKTNKVSEELLGDAYNNLCLAYNLMYEYDLGLEYGNLAVQIPPDSSVVYSNRGNAYFGLSEYEKALQDYDRAIEIDNTNSFAFYGKGAVYYDQGEYEKSLESFEQCIAITPDDIDALEYIIWCHYYLGDYDKGIELSDKVIKMDDNFDIYYAKGMNIQGKEGYEKAESYYKEVADLFSDEVEAQMTLGKFYYDNVNYKKALECFVSTNEKFEPNPDLDCWIILCYTAMGDMEKADSYYQEVLEAGNATVNTCNYIGDEFTYQGYYMESIKYYDEAIRIDKKNKEAYINKMYSLYYGKRFSRCIEFGKNALEKFKDNYDIIFCISESYYNLSNFKEALSWHEHALNVKPNNDLILSYISDTYLMLEDYENAEKYANEALSINRNNYTAQEVKAAIEKRQTPIEEQIKDFIKTNYLYYDKENEIDQVFQHDNMSNEDISNALEAVKKADDIFTFCIYDNYYVDYYESYLKNVEYVDYDFMKYIRIYDFNESTDDQFIEILDSIEEPENIFLTIDLRMNGGGQTLAANNILDVLLPSCVTCTLIDRDGYTYNYYSDASQIKFEKIFILVDEQSASASELLTLGLKTFLNNVTVIGSNTYGKGVGQSVYEDKNKNLMVFLVNHYWNVREQNIKDIGIAPDVYVKSENLSDYIDVIKARVNK